MKNLWQHGAAGDDRHGQAGALNAVAKLAANGEYLKVPESLVEPQPFGWHGKNGRGLAGVDHFHAQHLNDGDLPQLQKAGAAELDVVRVNVIARVDGPRLPLLREWVFVHLTKTALVVDDDAQTRKPRGRVQKVGIDPHFAFANMLCDVAWARAYGTATFFFPQAPKEAPMQETIRESLPGVPAHVIQLVAGQTGGETCGKCESFDTHAKRHALYCFEWCALALGAPPARWMTPEKLLAHVVTVKS